MEIIIIDDNIKKDDPLIVRLTIEYGEENIRLFNDPEKGLQYIKDNVIKKMIVVLDINFPNKGTSGQKILSEIRAENKLIPVIIHTARNYQEEDFTPLINDHAWYFIQKPSDYATILRILKDAERKLKLDVATAIEDWLEEQEDKNQVISISSDGKKYSVNDLIAEIRMQKPEGLKLEEQIIQLTIDLIFRKKETL